MTLGRTDKIAARLQLPIPWACAPWQVAQLGLYCRGSIEEAQRQTGWSREICERYAAGEETSLYHAMLLGLIGRVPPPSENPSE